LGLQKPNRNEEGKPNRGKDGGRDRGIDGKRIMLVKAVVVQ